MKKSKLLIIFIALTIIIAALTGCGTETTTYTREITVSIPGLSREYNYFVLNDTHINILNEETKTEYVEDCISRNLLFCNDSKFSYQNYEQWMKGLDRKNLDGIILNADIIDQLSFKNLSFVIKNVEKTKLPYMYLQSDHDRSTDWTAPDEEKLLAYQSKYDLNKGYYSFEEDSFIIIGLNFSYLNISEDTLNSLKSEFSKGKPIILFTHVPLDSIITTAYKDLSLEMKTDQVLLWGFNDYDSYEPDEYMAEFLNMVYDDNSPVLCVVAAHLHKEYDNYITENTKEYLTGVGYGGTKTLLRIIPE